MLKICFKEAIKSQNLLTIGDYATMMKNIFINY